MRTVAITLIATGAAVTIIGVTIAHPVMWLGLWGLADDALHGCGA